MLRGFGSVAKFSPRSLVSTNIHASVAARNKGGIFILKYFFIFITGDISL